MGQLGLGHFVREIVIEQGPTCLQSSFLLSAEHISLGRGMKIPTVLVELLGYSI